MGSCSSGSRGGSGGLVKNHLTQSENKLVYGLSESERSDFYYHSTTLGQKTIDNFEKRARENGGDITQGQIEFSKNAAMYESVIVNEKLPTLTGSEKQVKWAEDIRNRKISDEIDAIKSRVPERDRPTLLKEFKQRGIKAETFSDCVNYALTQSKTFNWLKNETSAKKIIDNR